MVGCDEICPRGHVQFLLLLDGGHVGLHSATTDVQPLTDLPIDEALCDQPVYFLLTVGEDNVCEAGDIRENHGPSRRNLLSRGMDLIA